jgi:hypothetical protein
VTAQQGTGQDISPGDHGLAAQSVEETAQQQRAREVPGRERQQVQPHAGACYVVERRQRDRVGEEDRVVEERLADEQGEAERGAPGIAPHQGSRDGNEPDRVPLPDRDLALRLWQLFNPRREAHLLLNVGDDIVGLPLTAVDEQPAGAFRHIAADQQYHQGQHHAEAEAQPPADVYGEELRVEQHKRGGGARGGAEPIRAVDDQVDPAADAGGISSSMAELIAAYSPPMPAPVMNRNRKNHQAENDSAVSAVAAR